MSCKELAIKIDHLTKSYQIYSKPRDRLLQMICRNGKQLYKEFSALSDVSFSVNKGDSVGVLGHNGAGKSTLLQIITGVLTPTSGDVKTDGRIAALLELGAGFNPEFTGKENVFMSAAILGLSTKEIKEKYDDILKFAEIGDFIHRPVKTYSSGMYVRLAFAVAVHTDPEILIVDEALAVGDIRFQMKCIQYMQSLKEKGTTILFVSHSPEQVKRFCNKAIWLDGGKLVQQGSSSKVCDMYKDHMARKNIPVQENEEGHLTLPARILATRLESKEFHLGATLRLSIEYEVIDEEINGLLVGAAIYTSDRTYVFGPNTCLDKFEIPYKKGRYHLQYVIPSLPLLPGSYTFDVGIFTDQGLVSLDFLTSVQEFTVFDDYNNEGLVYIKHEWKLI
ncbi:ABC transporter ATP-binding protein [Salinivibrio sp. YCSC6]|uniref:ABC transporter ATP-binding protein n=1 Tax=Salinivibrio sp. YCSC6 TaxID=2003370 RepID=UPI000BBC0DF1|nr:ABC transporter ATP-binding protein [Salinivibrio sp. YCSC6]PCE67661.1 teichoic acid ABC transporter ATP-binding protein [Salinivibrio sp. YCSC6]QCF35439.1 ABC transporter ATP-binding protein [Salinivibrio sp. YCSC6]